MGWPMIHVSSSGQASPRNSPRVLGHDRVDCVQRWLLPEFESFHLLDRLKHHRRDRVQQNCPRASGSNGVGWCERQGRGAAQLFLPPPLSWPCRVRSCRRRAPRSCSSKFVNVPHSTVNSPMRSPLLHCNGSSNRLSLVGWVYKNGCHVQSSTGGLAAASLTHLQ